MDWRIFVQQNHIKNLPLTEQRQRYIKALNEAEMALAIMAQAQVQNAYTIPSQTGAAIGGSDPLDIKMTTVTEIITQDGFALRNEESTHNLATEQQF